MDEARRSPATLGLSALWVLVFLAMHLWQGSFSLVANPFGLGLLQTDTTHLFGDATSAELASGQVWRALTSTFIHFSVLHLILNVLGLLPLGMLIESWYGWAQLLLIYVVIGTFGNLIAGEARPLVGVLSRTHSGGGSTVVFGFIALCAVVGLRSRSRGGRELGRLMLGILLLNYALGFAFWACDRWLGWNLPKFDHLAHASGTFLGALVGLWHETLKRMRDTRFARWTGIASLLILAAAFGLQLRQSRAEISAARERAIVINQWRRATSFVANLARLDLLYQLAFHRGEGREFVVDRRPRRPGGIPVSTMIVVPEKTEIDLGMKNALDALERSSPSLPPGDAARAYQRMRSLASQAIEHEPSSLQLQEFESRYATLYPEASRNLLAAQRRLATIGNGERGR
jgi:membrane associated rhomboid family serine protease